MTVTFLDPRAQPSLPAEPYDLAALDPTVPATIALLANGFPDSVAFLDHVEEALLDVAPVGTRVRRYAKPNASTLVSAEVLQRMTTECHALVTAYGHWGSCTSGTVRDGISMARTGRPSIALVSTDFWSQGHFVARAAGMPDVPRVEIPHPVAGTGAAAMRGVAVAIAPTLRQILWTSPGACS